MQSLMMPETFSKHFSGFNIIDCAVRSREILYLLGLEDYTRWPKEKWNPENTPPPAEDRTQKRIYPTMLHNQPDKVFSSNHLNGFDLARLGVCMLPKEQCVVILGGRDLFNRQRRSGDRRGPQILAPGKRSGPRRREQTQDHRRLAVLLHG